MGVASRVSRVEVSFAFYSSCVNRTLKHNHQSTQKEQLGFFRILVSPKKKKKISPNLTLPLLMGLPRKKSKRVLENASRPIEKNKRPNKRSFFAFFLFNFINAAFCCHGVTFGRTTDTSRAHTQRRPIPLFDKRATTHRIILCVRVYFADSLRVVESHISRGGEKKKKSRTYRKLARVFFFSLVFYFLF